MARSSSVSYEAGPQAYRRLLAEGKNLSFPLPYTALGNVEFAKIVQSFIN